MPNIENLRKQAKQILRWHRDGHYPVAEIVRNHSARFSQMSDREILDNEFKLTDALEVVAAREGFESWPALTTGVKPMSKSVTEQTLEPSLIAAEPQLFVADIGASCQYFESALGFSIGFQYGEPPFYAQVVRDGVALNLRHVDAAPVDREVWDREGFLSASITVRNIKELFLEFQKAGAAIHRSLKTEPWGARTFLVKDLDGNLILFAG